MSETLARIVSEAIRAGYTAVDLWQTSLGLYVVIHEQENQPVFIKAEALDAMDWTEMELDEEGDGYVTAYETVATRRATMLHHASPLPQDEAELKRLSDSMYDVGWQMMPKGSGFRLEPHRDAAGRADIAHRFAQMIAPLQQEMAAVNASLADTKLDRASSWE